MSDVIDATDEHNLPIIARRQLPNTRAALQRRLPADAIIRAVAAAKNRVPITVKQLRVLADAVANEGNAGIRAIPAAAGRIHHIARSRKIRQLMQRHGLFARRIHANLIQPGKIRPERHCHRAFIEIRPVAPFGHLHRLRGIHLRPLCRAGMAGKCQIHTVFRAAVLDVKPAVRAHLRRIECAADVLRESEDKALILCGGRRCTAEQHLIRTQRIRLRCPAPRNLVNHHRLGGCGRADADLVCRCEIHAAIRHPALLKRKYRRVHSIRLRAGGRHVDLRPHAAFPVGQRQIDAILHPVIRHGKIPVFGNQRRVKCAVNVRCVNGQRKIPAARRGLAALKQHRLRQRLFCQRKAKQQAAEQTYQQTLFLHGCDSFFRLCCFDYTLFSRFLSSVEKCPIRASRPGKQ